MLSLLIGVSTPPVTMPPILQPPPAIVQKTEPQKVKIVKGDTLTKIAKEKNVTVERLFDKNTQLENPDVLKVGDILTIPEPSEVLESRKPPVPAEKPSEPIKRADREGSTGLNGYYAGQCTGYVASRRYVPPGWGNASDWGYNAKAQGWTVSSTPVPGAIAWRSGHVAYVESVGNGVVTISEANYDYRGSIRTITIPVGQYQYIY